MIEGHIGKELAVNINHHPAQLAAAASAVAAAAVAPANPVIVFDADLTTRDILDADELRTPDAQAISVTPPDSFLDCDHLVEICAHRIRKALLRFGFLTGKDLSPSIQQFGHAIDVLVAAAERRELPGDWIALRAVDLREVTLIDYSAIDDRLRGGVLWLSLAGLPRRYDDALAPARTRVGEAIAVYAEGAASTASVTRLRPVQPPVTTPLAA